MTRGGRTEGRKVAQKPIQNRVQTRQMVLLLSEWWGLQGVMFLLKQKHSRGASARKIQNNFWIFARTPTAFEPTVLAL